MSRQPETTIIAVRSDVEQLKGCALFEDIVSNCSVRIQFRGAMTKEKRFKQMVRAVAKRTGKSYAATRARLDKLLASTSRSSAGLIDGSTGDHWEVVEARVKAALALRLRAAHQDVTPPALLQALDASTDADFAALCADTLQVHDHEERELIRAFVRVRLTGDERASSIEVRA